MRLVSVGDANPRAALSVRAMLGAAFSRFPSYAPTILLLLVGWVGVWFVVEISVIVGDCATSFTAIAVEHGGFCEPLRATVDLVPGVYYFTVAPGTEFGPIFHGISCEDSTVPLATEFGRHYQAELSCLAPLDDEGRAAFSTDP